MPDALSGVERLLALEEVRDLKARYCRAIDTKDWPLLASCYTPDTLIDITGEEALDGFREPIVGVDAVVASIRDALGDGVSVHVTFLPEITFHSADDATGIWGIEYVTWQPPGSTIPMLHGYAYSHDAYRRVGGRWLIHQIRLDMLWTEPARPAPSA